MLAAAFPQAACAHQNWSFRNGSLASASPMSVDRLLLRSILPMPVDSAAVGLLGNLQFYADFQLPQDLLRSNAKKRLINTRLEQDSNTKPKGYKKYRAEIIMDPSSSSSSSSLLPPGVVFKPTDREILLEFLARKVHNLPLPNNAIVEMDVYDHHPCLYASGHNYEMDQYGKFYFVRREKKSKYKCESAKNPKRHLKSEGNSNFGGWWKAITGDKPICNNRGRTIGFKKTLKFCTYNNQKYDRRECIKTDWIMHEYKLPHPTFQEWVVCGIRYNGGKGTGQEYALGCHSMSDNQQAQDSNRSLEWIDEFPQISFTESELEELLA